MSAKRRTLVLGAVAGVLPAVVAGCATGGAAEGPSEVFRRPVEMVVPFGSGGGADQVARAVGSQMEEPIDTDVPVINVPGATGSTGITNMLSGTPGESMSILIQDSLTTVAAGAASFSLDETQAVCRLQSMPSALMVSKDAYEDWEDLAADAKENPGELTVATVGSNSVDDIVLAALQEVHGTEFRAVPYSEPGERYAALLGGEVDVLYEQLGDVRSYLDSGDFVPLVIMSDKPVEGYEDVPLATDIGLPDEVVLPQFRGIIVDAQTNEKVVARMSKACDQAVASSDMQTFQEQVYAEKDSYQDAQEFQAFLNKQYDLIAKQLDEYGVGAR